MEKDRTLASSMIAVTKSILPKRKQSPDPFRDDIAVWCPSPVSAELQPTMPPPHWRSIPQLCYVSRVSPAPSILRRRAVSFNSATTYHPVRVAHAPEYGQAASLESSIVRTNFDGAHFLFNNGARLYGPIFVGVVFNILLYGIMITQTFLYFTVYKKDRVWMKIFVALLFICDTVNCAFDISFLYIPLVNNFGNPASLMYATWVFATDPVMTALIGALTQCFFAWRVNVLTHSIPAVIFISFCALCQLCGGLGTSIAVGMIPEFVHFQKFEIIVIVWLAFSAVADCAITVALVWHLRKHKTGFVATDDIVNRIIRLTVQTGLITALCAVIDLVLFLATPSGLHLVFNLPLSKLYTNSLMSSLNSRAGWRFGGTGNGETTDDDMARNEGTRNTHIRGEGSRRVSMMTPNQVYIDVESHEMVDVIDTKTLPSDRMDSMPRRHYSEKGGKLCVAGASDSF
ncbi:hypothetical protein TRAPUB_954 [Trametes pubescens]|uniref:DUF6534 domain-containing protein n=1 Tax=Trametes pubescens TaxID=154538 RepID=A0A1M2VKR0_TRAPU|nr:hypothetical protein TRAPUB_954 [Trametes pubescens]